MLIEMKSPAFKKQGEKRPPIHFKEGLNVVLGKEDGAMSIGKSSSLLAIDFVFGGDTYIKSDGVKKEGTGEIPVPSSLQLAKNYFLMVGSIVSRTQSPRRHILSVVRKMVRPGITASHQLVII